MSEVETIYLSRRNLLALLSKLDRVAEGDSSHCAIIKFQNDRDRHEQTMPAITIVAVEDKEYYEFREAGRMIEADEKNLPRPVAGITGDVYETKCRTE